MASMKSFEPAVMPVTATSAPASLPTVAGTTSVRRVSSERSEAASVPLPWTERATTATVLSGLISTAEGSESRPVASAWSCSSWMAAWTGAARDVVGLDHGQGRDGAAGEGGLDAVVGLDDRLAARVAVEAGLLELDAERRDAEGDEQAAGDQRRHERALEDAGEDGAPDARLALGLVAALGDVGDAALLEPVLLAEEGEHRGQEGHRAEHGDGDDEHRADAEADEDRVAGEQQPGHRGHHGQARDQHRAAGRGGGDLHGGLGRVAAVALLHHAARVEHRVVDADGEADDHDELGDVGRERRRAG